MTTVPLFALLLAAAASPSTPAAKGPSTPAARRGATTAKLDPCSLLDAKAIEAAQGAAPKETTASEHPDSQLVSQQCFFTLPDFARSISLEVSRPGPSGGPKALRKRWQQITGEEKRKREEDARERRGATAHEPAGRGGEEEEGRPPRPVKGVGHPAVWTGNAKAGALYVFDRKGIVRVSVGGKGSEEEKIKSCSTLARNALKHLPALAQTRHR